MTADTQQPTHLFAAYLELVKEDGPHRRRKQWVILPQMPARLAPGDSPITSHLSWFEREQRNTSHRAVWRFHGDISGHFRSNLQTIISDATYDGWSASEMITCEIDPTELAQILKDRKTPYRILQRLQKVARSMYRLDIS